MRKAIVLAGLALAAAGAAEAADFGVAPRPYAPAPAVFSAYNWMGPYIGANIGLQWGKITRNPTEPTGVAGGAQLGYNWQGNHLVVGLETDIQASSADDMLAPWKFSNPWFGTLRARAGFAVQNMLFFATGGFALGSLKVETAGVSERDIHLGWAAGAGVEAGVTRNVSARVDYLFVSLGDRSYGLTGVSHGLHSHLLRLGINYRF